MKTVRRRLAKFPELRAHVLGEGVVIVEGELLVTYRVICNLRNSGRINISNSCKYNV